MASSGSPPTVLGGWLALATAPAMFALVGVSSTAIDVATFSLLVAQAQVPSLHANTFSYSLGAINSFRLNKFITCRDRGTHRGPGAQLALFVVMRLLCLAIASLVLAVALQFMATFPAKLGSIVRHVRR